MDKVAKFLALNGSWVDGGVNACIDKVLPNLYKESIGGLDLKPIFEFYKDWYGRNYHNFFYDLNEIEVKEVTKDWLNRLLPKLLRALQNISIQHSKYCTNATNNSILLISYANKYSLNI